jgi:hypothetical protein
MEFALFTVSSQLCSTSVKQLPLWLITPSNYRIDRSCHAVDFLYSRIVAGACRPSRHCCTLPFGISIILTEFVPILIVIAAPLVLCSLVLLQRWFLPAKLVPVNRLPKKALRVAEGGLADE